MSETNTTLTTANKDELRQQLPEQLSKAQLVFIAQKTPAVFIKQRAGRGGQTFSYVEIGYIIKMLNAIFGFGGWDWEYQLVEPLSFPHTNQIVLTGKLTVKIFQDTKLVTTIVKTASGGKDVALLKDSQKPVDLGDDVKSASADALKKAASLLGIAEDVYAPGIYKAQEAVNRSRQTNNNSKPAMSQEDITPEVEAEMERESPEDRNALLRGIFAAAKDLAVAGKLNLLGLDNEGKKLAVKEFLKTYGITIDSFAKADLDTLRTALNQLERLKSDG